MAESTTALPLDRIRLDGGTQPRAHLNNDVVGEFADDLERGASLPPGVVYFDGSDHWLASGFTRYHAHKRAGRSHMECVVRQGTVEDARLFAASTNGKHGQRRSPEDKRRAVHLVLEHPTGKTWPAERIAEHCQVGVAMVEALLLSSRWKPPVTLWNSPDETAAPPPPDLAHAPIEQRVEAGKATPEETRDALSDEDRAKIEGKVARLVRKLCRNAAALGETPEGLLARFLRG